MEWQNSHDLPVAFVWVPSGMINAHGRGWWQTASILRLNKSCNVMKQETVLAHTCVEQMFFSGNKGQHFSLKCCTWLMFVLLLSSHFLPMTLAMFAGRHITHAQQVHWAKTTQQATCLAGCSLTTCSLFGAAFGALAIQLVF